MKKKREKKGKVEEVLQTEEKLTSIYHEGWLDCIKCFFCTPWNGVFFHLHSINVVHYTDWFLCVWKCLQKAGPACNMCTYIF